MNELRIGSVTKTAGVTIIPVEKINIFSEMSFESMWWHGSKELYALVVSTSSGIQAFDINAQAMNISDLISNVPQLADTLNSHRLL